MVDLSLAYLLLLTPFILLAVLFFIVRPYPVKIPIKNRHVFITGGSSGIGLALAHQAASAGARVSILARSQAKLEEAKRAVQLATGIDVATFAADVRDFDAVNRAVEAAGPVDVLVVNQGVFVPGELERLRLDEFRFMIDVNLIGSFNMIKAVLPAMKGRADKRPASIALMSSQAGQIDSIDSREWLFAETKIRPQLTNIIAESSGAMKAEVVAKKALDGIKSGSFIVPCSFEGLLLSIATAGMSPQRSSVMAFVEVVAIGWVRFAALFFQWNWYGLINKWHAQQK
ncbi:hypothetical protein SAY86_017499 [Trapa natans]|uniref:3-dehydrosphinganine reductase n=1 Tax=Trapa natans TaxID=22666 RepID=A0AAN7M6D6_TRANT|nr:hypothetical protein SAY86_017499 [Trapa natans]